MTKLVLEITSHSGDGSVSHRTLDSFPATLGRGYHNDIIILDPHVSAQHLRIDYDGSTFHVHDLGSENGLLLNEKHEHKSTSAQLKSGDTVRLGRTTLRIFDPAHPVPPAQRLQRANPFMEWLARPLTVWCAFALAIGASVTEKYYESWETEVASTLTGTAFSVAVIIIVWAALWAVAGKLVRHKSRFRSHVALISLFGIGMSASAPLFAYLGFLVPNETAVDILTFAIVWGMTLALLYGSLTLATDMTVKRKRMWTGFLGMGAVLSAICFAYFESERFVPAPSYSASLQPYFSSLAAVESVEGFMKGNEALFKAETLAAAPATPEKAK